MLQDFKDLYSTIKDWDAIKVILLLVIEYFLNAQKDEKLFLLFWNYI